MVGTRNDEKRRHDRAEVDGCVVVHVPGSAVHGHIVNISLGGMLVHVGEDARLLAAGVPVVVELEVEQGWATQAGDVIRACDGEIAIAFGRLDPTLRDVIDSEVREATRSRTNPRVVVVDPSPARRRRITDALREAGADSFEAATPLEAVGLIERSRVRVQMIAVAERTRSQTESDELVDWIEQTHPGLEIAMITDRPANPRSRHATLPGDEHADLRGPVRELLARRPSSS
jgi:hypothetical protein